MSHRVLLTIIVWVVALQVTVSASHEADYLGVRAREAREEREARHEKLLVDKYKLLDESEKAGFWPIKSLSSCDKVNTRDHGSDLEIARAARRIGKVNSGPDCGVNMYMDKERREEANAKRQANKRVKRSYDETDDGELTEKILNTLEHLVEDYRKLLQDEKKVDTVQNHEYLMDRSHMARTVDNTINIDGATMEARIIGGGESRDARHPWLVAIGKKTRGLSCGGTLINEEWVLTAAHCFDDLDQPCRYNIRLGSFNWLNNKDAEQVDQEPDLIVRHKDFNEKTLVNDIAMLRLSKPVKLSANSRINSACLPEDKSPAGTPCVATGWGTTHEGDKEVPETPHEVELPVLPYDDCGFTLTQKQLCAGYVQGGKDTCQGDSGGPLLNKQDGRWRLTGVTSFGNGCARPKWPGIYTDVSSYRDFIISVINRY